MTSVDHTLIDQASVLRFIEDNWLAGERIQPGGSFDTIAGKLDNMFDFDGRDDEPRKVILDPKTGLGLTGRRSVKVIAPKGILSDSLSKVASVLPPGKALPVVGKSALAVEPAR